MTIFKGGARATANDKFVRAAAQSKVRVKKSAPMPAQTKPLPQSLPIPARSDRTRLGSLGEVTLTPTKKMKARK